MKNQSENKNINNESHEYFNYFADLMGILYIFHFSMRDTYISDPKRAYDKLKLCQIGNAIVCTLLYKSLTVLINTFFCKSKVGMNL